MTNTVSDIAFEGGRDIVLARTPSELERSMLPLVEVVYEPWRSDFDEEFARWGQQAVANEFLVALAREDAVGVGTRALLLGQYDPHESMVEQTVDALSSFRRGLHAGGMGRGTAKALIGRAIANEAEARYAQTGLGPHAAGRYELIGNTLKVFDWRDKLSVASARLHHRREHGISVKVVDRLMEAAEHLPDPTPAIRPRNTV